MGYFEIWKLIAKNLEEFERFIWKYAFHRKRWMNKIRIAVWLMRKAGMTHRQIPIIIFLLTGIKIGKDFVDYTCKKIDGAIEKYYGGEFFRKLFRMFNR